MFTQVRKAIEPKFSLAETLIEWHLISELLSESPRNRKLQLSQDISDVDDA
jgi:hypothetical protein